MQTTSEAIGWGIFLSVFFTLGSLALGVLTRTLVFRCTVRKEVIYFSPTALFWSGIVGFSLFTLAAAVYCTKGKTILLVGAILLIGLLVFAKRVSSQQQLSFSRISAFGEPIRLNELFILLLGLLVAGTFFAADGLISADGLPLMPDMDYIKYSQLAESHISTGLEGSWAEGGAYFLPDKYQVMPYNHYYIWASGGMAKLFGQPEVLGVTFIYPVVITGLFLLGILALFEQLGFRKFLVQTLGVLFVLAPVWLTPLLAIVLGTTDPRGMFLYGLSSPFFSLLFYKWQNMSVLLVGVMILHHQKKHFEALSVSLMAPFLLPTGAVLPIGYGLLLLFILLRDKLFRKLLWLMGFGLVSALAFGAFYGLNSVGASDSTTSLPTGSEASITSGLTFVVVKNITATTLGSAVKLAPEILLLLFLIYLLRPARQLVVNTLFVLIGWFALSGLLWLLSYPFLSFDSVQFNQMCMRLIRPGLLYMALLIWQERKVQFQSPDLGSTFRINYRRLLMSTVVVLSLLSLAVPVYFSITQKSTRFSEVSLTLLSEINELAVDPFDIAVLDTEQTRIKQESMAQYHFGYYAVPHALFWIPKLRYCVSVTDPWIKEQPIVESKYVLDSRVFNKTLNQNKTRTTTPAFSQIATVLQAHNLKWLLIAPGSNIPNSWSIAIDKEIVDQQNSYRLVRLNLAKLDKFSNY